MPITVYGRRKSPSTAFFSASVLGHPYDPCHTLRPSFFDRPADQVAVFQWTIHAWIWGADKLYGDLTYFGWTPLLVIGALVAIAALNIALGRAIFRKPATLT